MFPLLLLPVELTVRIFCHLARRDIDRVQQTNRRLRKIVKKHNLILPIEPLILKIELEGDRTRTYTICPMNQYTGGPLRARGWRRLNGKMLPFS